LISAVDRVLAEATKQRHRHLDMKVQARSQARVPTLIGGLMLTEAVT
jgi:hypothetical protein